MTVENSKGECNLGQHEINFRYGEALARRRRPRRSTRTAPRRSPPRRSMAITFMAKFNEREGNSCHIHCSLARRGRRQRLRRRRAALRPLPRRPARLHARADACSTRRTSTPTSASPRARSRRRRSPGATTTAPARCASSATAEALRVENRLPGADVNPYLALAAMIAAGLHGIDNELELEEPLRGQRLRVRQAARCRTTCTTARDLFAEQRGRPRGLRRRRSSTTT